MGRLIFGDLYFLLFTDETDSGGTSSSDTPRERKRWDKDRPYTPRKQPLEDDDRIEPPADGAYR